MSKNEINDLYNYGYKIVQNPDYFKFSLDSIILADFVNIDFGDKKLVDLCTGNAPIPLILSKNNLDIYGMEIQNEVYNLGLESLNLNNIKNVHLINDNIKNYKLYFKENSIDIITCNPPYFKINSNSIVNKNKIKMIARHEVEITLEEIIDISSKLLKSKGKLFLVYNTSRFVELIKLLDKYKFGVKRIDCVYNDLESNCSMILVEAKKDGKDDVIITKPILSKNYRGDIL